MFTPGAFIEELSLDDLKGTGAPAKWTLPGALKLEPVTAASVAVDSNSGSQKKRRRQGVVLRAKSPIILPSSGSTSSGAGPFVIRRTARQAQVGVSGNDNGNGSQSETIFEQMPVVIFGNGWT